MHKVSRVELLKAARLIATVTEIATTIPMASQVGISANGAEMTVRHIGLDATMLTKVACDGDAKAEFTEVLVSAARLVSHLAAMSADTINLQRLPDGRLELADDNRREVVRIMTMSPNDWVKFPEAKNRVFSVTLPAGVLQCLVRGVRHCVSSEETRYYLNGIAFAVEGACLMSVATDGHRLMQRWHTLPEGSYEGGFTEPLIIPRQVIDAIMHMGRMEADTVLSFWVGAGNNYPSLARVESGDTQLTCKLIDGKYPNFRQVIPKGRTAYVDFDAGNLQRAVRVVTGALERHERGVVLSVNGNTLGVRAVGQGAGDNEAFAIMPATSSGTLDEPTIGLNANYLREMVGNMGSKRVQLYPAGTGEPVRFEGPGNAVGILMPMRIDGSWRWKPDPIFG